MLIFPLNICLLFSLISSVILSESVPRRDKIIPGQNGLGRFFGFIVLVKVRYLTYPKIPKNLVISLPLFNFELITTILFEIQIL